MAINKQKKVFVGLSGGVDSSLAAALLLEKGYQVVGVYMKNWTENIGNMCCSTDQDAMDARLVAKKLGIPFYVWNFEKDYKEKVMGYFFSEYENGRTPNPDVLCNREIKFKLFLDRALALGADFVATGHYARIKESDGQFQLLKGLDANKDQSYFLCALTQTELAKIIFPIGDYTKTDVRHLAEKYNLHTAAKKDSQGICFVGEINIKEFLKNNIKVTPGKVVDTKGNLLGNHEGLAFYTIGQREGLSMLSNGPWYVVDKNLYTNDLVVSKDANDPLMWRTECLVDSVSWTNKKYDLPLDVEVSVRYRHEPALAKLMTAEQGLLKIIFKNPERAITPGQFAVFYLGEELIASATIVEVL
ncbi:MAG: tRNA 2-thiouridine(34) synthase MnmA [Patescibacteria group bacterium]|nr:tRNA 2-thiouridine(34) synthase MnmA [Patescibacteria group bacterium]